MDDYISRESALAFQNELEPVICKSVHSGGIYSATRDDDLVKFINAIPAADVTPVVRCKDCKHLCVRSGALGVYECAIHGDYPSGEYYCADGMRKDGDEDV